MAGIPPHPSMASQLSREGMAGIPPHPSMVAQPAMVVQTPPQAGFERHTTPENIRRFFDPNTYRKGGGVKSSEGVVCDEPTSLQKRPAPSDSSSAAPSAPAAKAKTMQKGDLMDKFKLAAKLNGIEWDEIAVSRMNCVQYIYIYTYLNSDYIYIHIFLTFMI